MFQQKDMRSSVMIQVSLVAGALLVAFTVILEAVLRRWSGVPLMSLKKRSVSVTSHRAMGIGSWKLSREVMRSRDSSFSNTHQDEMTKWHSSKSLEWWKPNPNGPTLFRFVNSDFSGTKFGVRNGLRVTRWQPDLESKRIFCL